MGLDIIQFKEDVILPVLEHLDLPNEDIERSTILLLGTALTESGLKYLKQLGNGPALGVYQIEPDTHDDIFDNYLYYRDELGGKVCDFIGLNADEHSALIYNLAYATAIARVHYYRVAEELPEADDQEGMANYWKKYYNTSKGKGTVEDFIRKTSLLFKNSITLEENNIINIKGNR